MQGSVRGEPGDRFPYRDARSAYQRIQKNKNRCKKFLHKWLDITQTIVDNKKREERLTKRHEDVMTQHKWCHTNKSCFSRHHP